MPHINPIMVLILISQRKEIQEADQNGDAHPAELEEDAPVETDAQEEKEEEDEREAEEEDESVIYHHTILSCLAHLHTQCVFPNLLFPLLFNLFSSTN